jgi:hydroxyacylglutathione hydrolase
MDGERLVNVAESGPKATEFQGTMRPNQPVLTRDQMQTKTFTAGIFDTNCFLVETGTATILIDAPQESAEWLERIGAKVDLLLLTHGHIDHGFDAARIKREHRCEVAYHIDGRPMLTEPGFFRRFGFQLEMEPVAADLLLEETPSVCLGGIDFQILLVPGHCPGSLCFFDGAAKVLYGGDVLFAGGVGRWDLPGGDCELLLGGIRTKVLPLGDEVKVLPGHGPATTIGRERLTNPYIA